MNQAELNNEEKGIFGKLDDEFEIQIDPTVLPAPPAEEAEENELVQVKIGDRIIEAESYQEIAEKLAKEQEEASLFGKPKKDEDQWGVYDPTYDIPPLTGEELFVLGQTFATDPAGVHARLSEALFAQYGLSLEQVAHAVQDIQEMQNQISGAKVGTEFAVRHKDDYYRSPRNAALMERYILDNELDVNAGNLELAFTELKRRGILEPPPPKTSGAKTENQVTSGLSPRLNNEEVEENGIPNVDKLQNMSAAQLEAWIKGQEAIRNRR